MTNFMRWDTDMDVADVYACATVVGGDAVEIGPLRLSFADAVHLTPAISTRVEVDGRSIVYSGDTSGLSELGELARGADLFVCEAAWSGDNEDHPPGMHLTARDAAVIAKEAGVGHLVLTHIIASTDRDLVLTEAQEVFDGPVDLAEDLASFVLG